VIGRSGLRFTWLRAGFTALLVSLAFLVPVAVRVVWEQSLETARAQRATDLRTEIESLGRAARWRTPLSHGDDAALERLRIISEEALERGDSATAVTALREVRGAILATRVWSPTAFQTETLAEVNRQLAFMTGAGLAGEVELERIPGPHPFRANLAALAFVAWLVGTIGFLLQVLDRRGYIHPGRAVRWGGAWLLLLIAWMVLLRFA